MASAQNNIGEIIVVRSLTDSDLGIFAAHRQYIASKQRAVNINAPTAKLILSPELFESADSLLDCIAVFGNITVRKMRSFKKVHKNWRLGGEKLEGNEFSKLDSKDFILIRTVAGNDGTHPVAITFVGKKTDQIVHAGIAAILEKRLDRSMAVVMNQEEDFGAMSRYCPSASELEAGIRPDAASAVTTFPPMPAEERAEEKKPRSMKEKIRQPHILEKMLQVTGDLSAPAQHRFLQTVEHLASALREILLETGRIIHIKKDHATLWKSVAGKPIGFVDGGLANLSMLGSAPIAARVGGYTVVPGDHSPEREKFTVLKCLIDELYTSGDEGVFSDSFPDLGALRDAARISIEAGGAVNLLQEQPELAWLMLHGSLVSPVSRYTDVIQNGEVKHRFPNFSAKAIETLLPGGENDRQGKESNFISIYLRQLELLMESDAVVCGVVERPGTTTTVCHSVLDNLTDYELEPLLDANPTEWRRTFRKLIDPSDDEDMEGQRITDSLLFRCVLEPGEAILPVPVERNLLRKAPEAWKTVIGRYPKPMVSYLQPTEWNAPVRIEFFEKDLPHFRSTAELIMHCCLLLPRYAFPAGLDIVDKYAKIPNWMSRPFNTRMAVSTLKQALDSGDEKLFDSVRHILCGSGREWLLRPGIYR